MNRGGCNMTDTELRDIFREHLTDDILSRDGQLLYSGIDMLRDGDFYFVGFNPAADGTNDPLHKLRLHHKDWSAYTCQCWMCKGKCNPTSCPKTGEAKHQRNVKHIMSQLDLKPKTTFATNYVFVQSDNVEALKKDPFFRTYVDRCWLVHKRMLAEVRPKYIVCLGNGESGSAFSLVREQAKEDNGMQRETHSIKRVGTKRKYIAFKSFWGTFDLDDGFEPLRAKVIGVLHPSRWRCPEGLHDWVFEE
jgi:hypothetical protein